MFLIFNIIDEGKLLEDSLIGAVSYYLLVGFVPKYKSGSAKPNRDKVAKITKAQVEEIAKIKMPDLNAASLETACSMIAGTARSMGVVVED